MKKLMAVGCVLVSAFAAFAEYDETDGYVRLKKSDKWSSGGWSSWNVAGNWSDGKEPHTTTNYYVPSTMYLWPANSNPGAWQGGPIVFAGSIVSRVSDSALANLPQFTNATFLAGSHLDTRYRYAGFRSSVITILAPEDNPFSCLCDTSTAPRAFRFPDTVFKGDDGTAVRFAVNAGAGEISCELDACNFAEYEGKVIADGSDVTVSSRSGGGGFDFAGPFVADGAIVNGATDEDEWKAFQTAKFGALDLKNGATFRFWQDAGEVRPKLEVANAFSYDSVSAFRFGNFDYADLDAATADADSDNRLMIAHLAKGETVTCPEGAVPDLWLNANGTRLTADWQIRVSDDGNGGKNVEAVYPRTVIKMIKKNSYSKPETRAFTCPDPENYWSTGRIPDSETTGDIVAVAALQAYSPLYLPNATLTYAGNVKGEIYENGDGDITVRELNLVDVATLYRYTGDAGHAIDTISGGTINLLGTQLNTMSIMVSHSRGFNFASSIVGTKTLVVQDRAVDALNNRRGYASFSGDNTGFHGRLVLWNRCPLEDDSDTRCFCTYLGNAKSWGGEFTQDAETFSAITFRDSPMVYVTNDVAFAGENVRGMFVTNGVRFNVSAEKTLALGNAITYAGEIAKLGDGTLEMSGTASILAGTDSANRIRVTAGTLKVSSATAVEGLDVSFAEGTKLVVDKDCGFVNTTAANPLTISDEKLQVEIAGFDEKPEDDVEVTVLTLNKTAAAGIGTDRFAFARTPTYKVLKFEKRESGDNVEYVATVGGKKGAVLLIR